MRKPTEKELQDYLDDTNDHILKVQTNIGEISENLHERAKAHDESKFLPEERDIYAVVVPEFKKYKYGTPEHKAVSDKLGPAWEHHLSNNDHHTQYHTNGVWDMDLMMIIEMLSDWKAASDRHEHNDYEDGLLINIEKYGIEDQLASILLRTAKNLGWI